MSSAPGAPLHSHTSTLGSDPLRTQVATGRAPRRANGTGPLSRCLKAVSAKIGRDVLAGVQTDRCAAIAEASDGAAIKSHADHSNGASLIYTVRNGPAHGPAGTSPQPAWKGTHERLICKNEHKKIDHRRGSS